MRRRSWSHLQQFVSHRHPSVPARRPTGVDSHHEHAHARAVPVPGQAEAQARLAFLQLDHVQDAWEVAVATDDTLCERERGVKAGTDASADSGAERCRTRSGSEFRKTGPRLLFPPSISRSSLPSFVARPALSAPHSSPLCSPLPICL